MCAPARLTKPNSAAVIKRRHAAQGLPAWRPVRRFKTPPKHSGFPLRPRRSMRRIIDHAVLSAALLCCTIPLQAQRGGRGSDSTGGRGAGLPLTPSKALKFTTDEGTWLSLDVSPDGRTIAFELLGDIYTIPIEGGKATRLTSGQMFDAQPHYSPDGTHIVF